MPSVPSAESGFRNKAKLVVSGSARNPVLGIVNEQGEGVDLCDCPLYPADLQQVVTAVRRWLADLAIQPYRIKERDGDLKFVLVNRASIDAFMLRLVLQNTVNVPRIRGALPHLLERVPQLTTVSVNIQPIAMAILEGPEEILLSGEPWLRHSVNELNIYQRPKGFFQTNTAVAERLYATARSWLADLNITLYWDLFCGSGGFGLHCLNDRRRMIGIEIEAEAVACARRSAEEMGFADRVSFMALDLTRPQDVLQNSQPDAVILNPPRRGIGAELCSVLAKVAPDVLLYSSCNVHTLAKDLTTLSDYKIERIQLFDMFAHTAHFEVLALLRRKV